MTELEKLAREFEALAKKQRYETYGDSGVFKKWIFGIFAVRLLDMVLHEKHESGYLDSILTLIEQCQRIAEEGK